MPAASPERESSDRQPDRRQALGEGGQRFIYGRRQAPRMRERQRGLLQHLLPRLALTLPQPLAPVPLAQLGLPEGRPLWLEVGFGGGEHLAATAAANPHVTIIGVEPFVTGVAKLLGAIDKQGLGNVRILMDDARLLLRALPDRCIERAFILYPDPWPKKRHNKRRIVNDLSMAEMARLMPEGGQLRIATDHADYLRWILAVMHRQDAFTWTAERPGDWRQRPPDQAITRYEEKAHAAGRSCTYLGYRRSSAPALAPGNPGFGVALT